MCHDDDSVQKNMNEESTLYVESLSSESFHLDLFHRNPLIWISFIGILSSESLSSESFHMIFFIQILSSKSSHPNPLIQILSSKPFIQILSSEPMSQNFENIVTYLPRLDKRKATKSQLRFMKVV